MAEIVSGLFGFNPSMLQQQQNRLGFAQDYQAVQLDPLQQANLALRQGGRGVAGLLGAEDPELAKARQATQLASQFDLTTPDGLRQYAGALQSFAPELAVRAAAEADKRDLTRAQTEKALRERVLPTSGLGKLLSEKQDLLNQGVPSNDPRIVAYDRAIAAEGEGKGVKVINMPPDTRGKAFEAADPEALKEYRTQARAAAGQVSLINQARENLPGAVVGQGLPTIIRGLNSQLAPLGINTEQVAKTRNLEQALKSIIAQGIKQYGANPSTVDLQFAVQAATNIQDPVQAIRATLDYLETRARANVNKADAAEQYLLKNNNLAGFEKQWSEQVTGPKPKGKTRTLKSGIVVTEED